MEKFNNILPDYSKAKVRSNNTTVIKREIFDLPDQIKNIGIGRKYYLRTYGCQANERDSETIAGILEALNFTRVDNEEEADVLFFNTCAIRKNAEDKVLGEIGMLKKLKRNNPDLIFALCGCMAQEEMIVKTILEKYPQVDLIFGTHNIHRLPWLLYNAMMAKEKTVEVYSKEGEVVENLPVSRFGKHKAWVNIMYGCDKFCTYCIVPYTRGKQRSRLPEDILSECEELYNSNYQEVTLLGQNVTAYGKDLNINYNMANLLSDVAKIGIPRVRFITSHPWDFTDEMIEVIAAYPNIMPYIHLPIQSGSDRILKLMGRKYNTKEYLELVDKLRKKIPNVSITTDIIVGFPGETKEDFQKTLDIVNEVKYDLAYTFIFSKRVGTPAEKMEDNVSLEEKKERLEELNQLINKYAKESNDRLKGQIVPVLIESESDKKGKMMGYTDTMKLVNVNIGKEYIGKIINVKITETKTWSIEGELCE